MIVLGPTLIQPPPRWSSPGGGEGAWLRVVLEQNQQEKAESRLLQVLPFLSAVSSPQIACNAAAGSAPDAIPPRQLVPLRDRSGRAAGSPSQPDARSIRDEFIGQPAGAGVGV